MVIIYADGGLGNRISSICNGVYIADTLDIEPEFFWPVNESCGAEYGELFETERIFQNKNKLELRALKRCSLLSIDNFLGLSKDFYLDPNKCLSSSKLIDWCRKQISGGRILVVFGHRIFPQIYSDVVNVLHSEIKFCSNIINLVSSIESGGLNHHLYFGFHYRGTDGTRGRSYRLFTTTGIYVATTLFKRKVFLATDDSGYADWALQKFKELIVIKHKRPEKRIPNLAWDASILDSNLEVHPYNITRDKDSMIYAACELILLSKARWLFPNSYSTFLEFAALYSQRRRFYLLFKLINRIKFYKNIFS
jgi:hypothetical protein